MGRIVATGPGRTVAESGAAADKDAGHCEGSCPAVAEDAGRSCGSAVSHWIRFYALANKTDVCFSQ